MPAGAVCSGALAVEGGSVAGLTKVLPPGPAGSTFVDPSSLPGSTATAPLQTAPGNNSAAR